jgi:hypothetical protein
MIFEKTIKFNVKIKCTGCNKQIQGGMKSSENYLNANKFNKELKKSKNISLRYL